MSKHRRGRGAPDRLLSDSSDFAPETYFSESSDSQAKSRARKNAQLCSQAARVIAHSLACDVSDEVIHSLVLDEVTQDAGCARLLVTFVAPPGSALDEIDDRLKRIRGVLRDALARGLSRKRVPQLSLVAIPTVYEQGDEP